MENIKRLWSRNFTILWIGQMVSDFGNAAFAIALGFWVLNATVTPEMPLGDLAKMGVIEACFAIPGVLFGPVAGAFADRHNRKLIIILADFARGVLFTLMGLTIYLNVFPFDAIYALAILAGACGSFFGPAISSTIPDIVSTDNLTKANSARSFSSTLTQLLGSSLGGWLYALLSAPVLIFFNGLSFLFASLMQLFIKVPVRAASTERKPILQDIIVGIKYTFGTRGIRTLVLTGMFINFFAVCGMILMTPLFNGTPGFGKEMYGLVMGTMMAGMVVGMLVFSVIKIKPSQRAGIFCLAMMAMVCSMVPVGLVKNVYWLFPLAFVSGITNAIVNVMLQTIMQITVAAENRGKVFGILGTVMGGLQPIAMVVSGFVAAAVGMIAGKLEGIQITMTVSFALLVLAALPLLLDRSFKAFINTDTTVPEKTEETDAVPIDGVLLSPAAGGVEQGGK